MDVHWPQFNQGSAAEIVPRLRADLGRRLSGPGDVPLEPVCHRSPDNYSDYSNPISTPCLTGRQRLSTSTLAPSLYAEAEAVLTGDNVVLPLAHDVRYTLMKPWVKGLEITPLGMLYLETPGWSSRWPEHSRHHVAEVSPHRSCEHSAPEAVDIALRLPQQSKRPILAPDCWNSHPGRSVWVPATLEYAHHRVMAEPARDRQCR